MGRYLSGLRAAHHRRTLLSGGQSYALKAVLDRCLTRSMTANRRNVLPLAGEVIQVPKYTCLFAAWFKKRTIWKYEKRNIQIPGQSLRRILAEADTRTVGTPVIRQSGEVQIQWLHDAVSSFITCSPHRFTTEPDTRWPAHVSVHWSG